MPARDIVLDGGLLSGLVRRNFTWHDAQVVGAIETDVPLQGQRIDGAWPAGDRKDFEAIGNSEACFFFFLFF